MSVQPERTKMIGVDDEPTRNLRTGKQDRYDATQDQDGESYAREQERVARAKALGAIDAPDEEVWAPEPPEKGHNDKFAGSLGLLFLRLVLAAYLSVRGIQILFDIPGTTNWLTDHHVPQGKLAAWALGIVLLLCTLMLVLGLWTRAASIIVAVLTISTLVFIQWGYASIFTSGQPGFVGDSDLLVAGSALALIFLGSGGWAADGVMRLNRAKDRAEQ